MKVRTLLLDPIGIPGCWDVLCWCWFLIYAFTLQTCFVVTSKLLFQFEPNVLPLFFFSGILWGLWLLRNMTSICLKLSCGFCLIFSMRPFALAYLLSPAFFQFLFWCSKQSNLFAPLLSSIYLLSLMVEFLRWWGLDDDQSHSSNDQ